jgi:hypothetical protein
MYFKFYSLAGPTKQSLTLRFCRELISKVIMALYITSAHHLSLKYSLMHYYWMLVKQMEIQLTRRLFQRFCSLLDTAWHFMREYKTRFFGCGWGESIWYRLFVRTVVVQSHELNPLRPAKPADCWQPVASDTVLCYQRRQFKWYTLFQQFPFQSWEKTGKVIINW